LWIYKFSHFFTKSFFLPVWTANNAKNRDVKEIKTKNPEIQIIIYGNPNKKPWNPNKK
jgi:hypothetical protein